MSDTHRFSVKVAVLGIVFAIGVHVDGWAHNHGKVDQSFFTPWHAVLYGTYFVLAFFVASRVLRARSHGVSWSEAIPEGYRLTVVGIVLFLLAGLGDMAWHIAFGVEESLDALLSPTHLALASSGILMAAGPFKAGMRPGDPSWRHAAPTVLTSLAILSFVGFMTQYANPYVELWPTTGWRFGFASTIEVGMVLGVAGFLWHAAMLSGFVLMLASRNRLPIGGLFLLVTGSTALIVSQGDAYWLVGPAALGAALLEVVRPRLPSGATGFRVLSFLVPAVPIGFHMAALAIRYEVFWSVHLWAGTPIMVGLVGVLVGMAIWPPGTLRPEDSVLTPEVDLG